MKTAAIAALIVALSAPVSAHGTTIEPARLTLTFETTAQTGAIMVSLFDSAEAYSGGAPVRQARVNVAKGERTAVFAGLPSGAYAVRAFHDVNGDERLTTNPFGRPIEPFAFSNNARGNMGPAGWEAAQVVVKGAAIQTIRFD